MSASLVGSEMCIRDRSRAWTRNRSLPHSRAPPQYRARADNCKHETTRRRLPAHLNPVHL
eukprot:5043648-Alexandrium_andersonii.AAC.1